MKILSGVWAYPFKRYTRRQRSVLWINAVGALFLTPTHTHTHHSAPTTTTTCILIPIENTRAIAWSHVLCIHYSRHSHGSSEINPNLSRLPNVVGPQSKCSFHINLIVLVTVAVNFICKLIVRLYSLFEKYDTATIQHRQHIRKISEKHKFSIARATMNCNRHRYFIANIITIITIVIWKEIIDLYRDDSRRTEIEFRAFFFLFIIYILCSARWIVASAGVNKINKNVNCFRNSRLYITPPLPVNRQTRHAVYSITPEVVYMTYARTHTHLHTRTYVYMLCWYFGRQRNLTNPQKLYICMPVSHNLYTILTIRVLLVYIVWLWACGAHNILWRNVPLFAALALWKNTKKYNLYSDVYNTYKYPHDIPTSALVRIVSTNGVSIMLCFRIYTKNYTRNMTHKFTMASWRNEW